MLRPPFARFGRRHPRPADVMLAVEVADSSASSDRRVKLPHYARSGIPEVWLANLAFDRDVVTGEPLMDRVLEVYWKPEPDGYAEVRVLRGSDTIAPETFPDMQIPVAELLGETDDDQADDDQTDGEADGADADPAEGTQR